MAYLIHNILPIPPRKTTCVSTNDTVTHCNNLMTELNIGALMVLDGNGKLVGIVSERDILRACIYKGLNPNTTLASDVAYTDVTIMHSKDTVEAAMKAITETKRRHVIIEEDAGTITILSIGDIMFHLLDDKARIIEHLENYIYS